ncbi:diguanylate cyclase [Amycolatopsis sp. NPDC059027]|uniref:GGDEF domain-containing protein n=1 Tax=unclassified Amycolatopsis TaxID=2618356 RepID=UPI00366E044D
MTFLGVEGIALALTAWALTRSDYRISDFGYFAALLALAVVQAELSRNVERIRRTIADAPHINMTSVWTFGGALVLPAGLAALLAVLVYGHLWLRLWRDMPNRPTYRVVYCAAAVVLSALAAGELVGDRLETGLGGSVLVVGAALVYTVTNAGIIAISVYLHTDGRSPRSLFGGVEDNLLEFATLVLGGMTALGLLYEPFLVPFVLLPVLVLHRSVLVRQLEVAASTDTKTGVLNARAWHELTQREFAEAAGAKGTFGVLMLDLDHFKRVNDTYGHLAGDMVLKAVATTISEQVRDYDSVGRFGGEEFVVLLPGAPEPDVLTVAERIRHAVQELVVDVPGTEPSQEIRGLSASIGVAMYPAAGHAVERLLHVADSALYQAKNTGRNQVVSMAVAAAT